MAIKVKPIEMVGRRYEENAGRAGPAYSEGLDFPKRDQAEAAIAAADAYNDGVTAAIADKRFEAGVRKAGTAKWREKAKALGPERYAKGVKVGAADFRKNFAPILAAIAAVELIPARPRGDPENIENVRRVAQAAREASLAK